MKLFLYSIVKFCSGCLKCEHLYNVTHPTYFTKEPLTEAIHGFRDKSVKNCPGGSSKIIKGAHWSLLSSFRIKYFIPLHLTIINVVLCTLSKNGLYTCTCICSDFVTNSYGWSWDSSCEKS